MNEKDIAKLLEAGGNRWSKYGKDRIYIDVTTLGLEVSYYKTGNVCNATWQGEGISNADAQAPARLESLRRLRRWLAACEHRL